MYGRLEEHKISWDAQTFEHHFQVIKWRRRKGKKEEIFVRRRYPH